MTITPTPPVPPQSSASFATAGPEDDGQTATVPLQNQRSAQRGSLAAASRNSSTQESTPEPVRHAPQPHSQPPAPAHGAQETVGPGGRQDRVPEPDNGGLSSRDGDGSGAGTGDRAGKGAAAVRDNSAPRPARTDAAPPGPGLPAPSRPGTPSRPTAAARKGPPGRRDSRRPDARRPTPSTGRPSASALRAAALRERERQPPYWFARQLLLILSGQAPVHTLLRHVHSAAYEQLAALAPLAPLRPRGTDRTTPALLEARGSRPRDGVIEAFARVSTGGRQRAMAFRLEYDTQRRWLCAAIELDGLSGVSTRARA